MRVKKLIDRSQKYEKTFMEGNIIYVDSTSNWCNIELPSGAILYRIYFGDGVNPRLRRVRQPVMVAQAIGSRYKYVVIGAARRFVDSTEFNSKGIFKWDDGTKWSDGHVWR